MVCSLAFCSYHIWNRAVRVGQLQMCMEGLLCGDLHHAGQVSDQEVGGLERDKLGHLKESKGLVRPAGVVDDQLHHATVGLEASLVKKHWPDAKISQTLNKEQL